MCNEASTSFRDSPHAAFACVDRMFSGVGFPALVENRKRVCPGSFASGVSAAGLEWLGSRARQYGGGYRASLFWVGRRPLEIQEGASSQVVEASSDGIKVLGTLLQGNTHFALLSVGGEVVRVSVGSELPGGWKVTSVKSGKVSMDNGSRITEVEVTRPRSDAVHLERLSN